MEDKGIITKALNNWKWKRKFTKEELEELNNIKKEAFMVKMRIRAKEEGIKLAEEENL